MKYITSNDISKKQIQRIANLLHCHLWPTPEKPFLKERTNGHFPSFLTVVAKEITDEKLTELLNSPICFLIDAHTLDESMHTFWEYKKNNFLGNQLGALLTCPVIYQCDIAKIFTEALAKRLSFSEGRQSSIHLALHEAIVNGLIHGNLQISSDLRQSARDFVEYARILNERLNSPVFAQKAISIWATWNTEKLEIKIRDEGAGYTVKQTFQRTSDGIQVYSGRGLKLIAGIADSCTIDDFGREITLTFSLASQEHYQVSEPILSQEPIATSTNLEKCSVLVIEDNPSNQILLGRLLNLMGITHIEIADDGVIGLEKIKEQSPDLVILDITMPRMSGYEVLKELKSNKATSDIPVLIETASDTREARDKTFSAGATDFITKPINPLEFFARVKVHLENKLLVHHLEEQLAQIDMELKSAQLMQVSLLPSEDMLKTIKQTYHLDWSYYFEPSSRLGGDFWELFPISSTQLGFYICDFSGHGVAASLNTFRLHTLMAQVTKKYKKPAHLLSYLNEQLYHLLPRGQFATFFLGVINTKKKTLSFAGAGAPNPLLKTGRKKVLLNATGMPLGISKTATYTEHTIPFSLKDTLILYSDALTENPNKKGERLGTEGFSELVKPALKKDSAQKIIAQIKQDFFQYAASPFPDDITLVVVKGCSE